MTSPTVEHHHGHGPANRGRQVLQTAAPLLVRTPGGRGRAAVVLLHDMHGLDERTELAARSLANCGYLTVVPYLYHQDGGRVFRPQESDAAAAAMAGLSTTDLADDVAGALDHLRRRLGFDDRDIGFAGMGAGAHLAALAAREHPSAQGIGVAPREGSWPRTPRLEELSAALGRRWLALPDTADAWDEAVRFLDRQIG